MPLLDTAMILAAGKGTRMRPLTNNCPKPLVKIGTRPLIEYALDQVRAAGLARGVVNTHYLADQLKYYFKGYNDPHVIVSHEDDVLDTGGGVSHALPAIDRTAFFTLNSDAFWSDDKALATLQAHWDDSKMDALLLLTPKQKAESYTRAGDFYLTDDGHLERPKPGEPAPYVYTGAQIIKSSTFANYADEKAFSLNAIWTDLLEKNRCFGCIYGGTWSDVGTPEGITRIENAGLAR